MPLLFSYGSLQQASVQLATFERLLDGREDELVGFEAGLVKIEDPKVVAESGQSHYANVTFNGRRESRVRGTVYEVSDWELASADEYERVAAYVRIDAVLASGQRAWLYVDARSARGKLG